MASLVALTTTKAMNTLLHFDDSDQKALLEVIEDYFTSSVDLDNDNDDNEGKVS